MFEYFPDNYGWSLAVMLAITSGGAISDIDDACAPLKPMAGQRGPQSSAAWVARWRAAGERQASAAEEDLRGGRIYSAGRKHRRACAYFMIAERMMRHVDPERADVYTQVLAQFAAWQRTEDLPVEFCSVPYEGTSLPALFVGQTHEGRLAPCMIVFDGFDVMKETMCLMDLHRDFGRRGVSLLIVDHPGVGEALRRKGLTAFPEYEIPAAACLDYLSTRSDVNTDRIGIMGLSAGGYFAARAAAFEKRLACCVSWCGIWSWGEVFEARLKGALPQALDFHLEHAEWVYGVSGVEAVLEVVHRMTMHGVADRIACPLLVTHGVADRQTPVAQAERLFNGAVNSSMKELRLFAASEGGDQHCHADNQTIGTDYIADWVATVLGGRTERHINEATPA